jgi:hypothetical protein
VVTASHVGGREGDVRGGVGPAGHRQDRHPFRKAAALNGPPGQRTASPRGIRSGIPPAPLTVARAAPCPRPYPRPVASRCYRRSMGLKAF